MPRGSNDGAVAQLLFLVALSFVGNAVVCGRFACRFCMQQTLDCPAEQLFSKSAR